MIFSLYHGKCKELLMVSEYLQTPTKQFPQVLDVASTPNLLFVDDDPLFCEAIIRIAAHQRIALTVCQNLEQVLQVTRDCQFDGAILDYFLGERTTAVRVA